MAQIREIELGPMNATTAITELDDQEANEYGTYMEQVTQDNARDMTSNAVLLFFEQRRRTRLWVIGCSVAAAGFGFLMGFYTGKKPAAKGR